MSVAEIQRIIDEYDYWDMLVKVLECNYFADEVRIIYDDSEGGDVCYNFNGCYKTVFDHVKDYDKSKPVKDMVRSEVPYYLQDVMIDEISEGKNHLWICKINMFPLYLEIWCKDIKIDKICK